MSENKEGKDALQIYEPVRALQTAVEARGTWEDFEALKKALLNTNDYQRIGNTAFIKRSGFRKIAVAFGLSDTILEQEKFIREDDSFYWRIMVQVIAPNGRVNTGVGICDSKERRFAHVEHDVYATAHTRAKSRAISDMVAGGAVSAEEMGGGPKYAESVQQVEKPKARVGDPPRKAPPKTGTQKPKPVKTQVSLGAGKVTVKTVAYNLHAAGIEAGEELVGEPREEGGVIVVEAMRELVDEDHYKVFGVLEPLGAVWREVGHFGQWQIPREGEASSDSGRKQVDANQEPANISRYDRVAVQDLLLNSGVPSDMIQVEQDDEAGICTIRNVKNNYDTVNPIVVPHGFTWVRGGRRWEREI